MEIVGGRISPGNSSGESSSGMLLEDCHRGNSTEAILPRERYQGIAVEAERWRERKLEMRAPRRVSRLEGGAGRSAPYRPIAVSPYRP